MRGSLYLDRLNSEIQEYFRILSPDFPTWMLDYINTPEMQRIGKISQSCGTDYSGCYNIRYWYSNLEHSVGVALILWNFTHDKKQTLAGLFHDIATPVFKHCIDFMNGDSLTQESTEERTTEIIQNSSEIMALLKRDGILLEEVNDYKKYPLADNDTPRLSADRFEYTFSSGLSFFRIWELDVIRRVYNDITIAKNEDGLDEFTFKNKEICAEYIYFASKIWPEWVSDKDRTVMQFIADMCRAMNQRGFLSIDDLYKLSEKEVIDKILHCGDTYLEESFRKFQKADKVYRSDSYVEGVYCINTTVKTRYVNPLAFYYDGITRISNLDYLSNEKIKDYLKLPKGGYYTYFDFDFRP